MSAPATTFATGHVDLNVADLDRSIDFYVDGIRLEVFTCAGAEAYGAAPAGAEPTCGFF